ncbi:hypothetical protein NE237_026840 [Protea cynaroides]|uniref:Uncharacterized protein n=1 Tax=Protea cynaroides TaxID=273540 RepID=A0A9Q0GLS8_9MAGN|nr:hypothetical protein NE237_026840 [Protea cynaroides]
MSVMSSLLLFTFLCLTVYACNARRLSIMDKESSRQVQRPGQDMEKVDIFDRTSSIPLEVKLSMSEEVQTRGQGLADANTQKLKDTQGLPKGVEKRTATISGFGQIESLVSVSWKVPREKYREHPALNMDYSPPETSPPIHN